MIDDAERTALAYRSGGYMVGPDERERCSRHPRRWVIFRWVWQVGDDVTGADPQVVRGCRACLDEQRAADARDLSCD